MSEGGVLTELLIDITAIHQVLVTLYITLPVSVPCATDGVRLLSFTRQCWASGVMLRWFVVFFSSVLFNSPSLRIIVYSVS